MGIGTHENDTHAQLIQFYVVLISSLSVVSLHCYTLDFVLTRSKYCKLLYCYCCNLLYYYYCITTTGILVNIKGRYTKGVNLCSNMGGIILGRNIHPASGMYCAARSAVPF